LVARLARILVAAAALTALWAPSAAAKLHVSGRHLVDHGRVVRLLGVNRSGAEYMCTGGFGDVFDGPHDQRSVTAMRTWRINAVRVPLNESCWLGVGRLRKWTSHYRRSIVRFVQLLSRNHLYVILDDHLSAPGRRIARDLLPMPAADHTPAFWRSVGRTFRRTSGVLFDLYNEPHGVSWRCWLHGCRVSRGPSPRSNKTYPAYRAAGMRTLLHALRSTGARQPVLLGGLAFAKDLSRWLRFRPRDPARQLVASLHTYGPATATHAAVCLDDCRREVAGIARRYPVVAGEIGEYDCAHAYIDDFMSWADGHGISYLGWTWDAVSPGGWQCGSGPALIESYDGTPTHFGVGLRDHLRAR
jgi:hypothetical protein